MSDFEFQNIIGTGTYRDGVRVFLNRDFVKDGRIIVAVSGGTERWDIETKYVTGFADTVEPYHHTPQKQTPAAEKLLSNSTATPAPVATEHVLELSIDGDKVTVTGTAKGDPRTPQILPRPWVWSRRAGGYVLPRSLTQLTRERHISCFRSAAEELGIAVEVEDAGTLLTEAQRRENRTGRLEIAADRHASAADRAAATATTAYTEARRIRRGYPMGQPILVGHHSEGRHRRDLARADRAERKWIDAEKENEKRARLAAGLRSALDNPESVVTIRQRIARNEAQARKFERALKDHDLAVKIQSNEKLAAQTGLRPMVAERHSRGVAELDRLNQAIELDKAVIAQREESGAVVTYSKDNVKVGDYVFGCGRWHEVKKVNKVTVSVPNGFGDHCDWLDKLPYAKITNLKTAAEMAEGRTVLAAKTERVG